MKFKFAAVALLASATLFCSESFGTDLLGRVLGRGCCGSRVSSCQPDCGCEAAPVVEDCGCTEVAEDCGCGGSRCGLLSRVGSRERRGILCGCGPTCPEPAPEPCCEPAPVVEDCGCGAEPACGGSCGNRVGLLNRLRARCQSRSCGAASDCGCEVVEEAPCCEPEPAPVMEDCGCDAGPACGGGSCGCRSGLLSRLRARCQGGSCGAAADCGCDAAPVMEDCGCDAAPAMEDCGCDAGPVVEDCGCDAGPSCGGGCGGGLLSRLRARCQGGSCGAASDCGCEVVEEAPSCEPAPVVEDCGCDAAPACGGSCGSRVGLLGKLMSRCQGRSCGAAADCGCEVAQEAPCFEPAPVMEDCGCEAEPACGCNAASACGGGRIRSRLAARPKLRSGSGVASCGGCDSGCGGGCDSGCGGGCDDNGCERLTLLDRLRGNRLPRDRRSGRVLCGSPNDGCNSPCPGGGCDGGYGAPVESGCSSCGGGEVISYGDPVDSGNVVPMQQESTPAEGIVVPNVNEAEGVITPGNGSASKAPLVRPEAFVIRAAR